MSWERIRPIALGVARRDGDVFVGELFDSAAEERFYRPVGGGIEFGENSVDALRREFREELGVEVTVTNYLGTIENVFTFDGSRGHEVAIVHGICLPEEFSAALPVEGHEKDGTTFVAEWKSLSTFTEGDVPLYPEGLVSLLTDDDFHVLPSN